MLALAAWGFIDAGETSLGSRSRCARASGTRALSAAVRFCLDGSTPLVNLYEIDIPMPRTAAPDERINGEIAKKRDPELEKEVAEKLKAIGIRK